jgi:SAM-dependent methyltransferase
MDTKTAVKLNLGSRDRAIHGFIGMDCDKHEGVDVVGDISDLSRYADGSVSEIYASHCLEHFPHPQTMKVLKEWHRVLEKGGILYVAVPDFARTVDLYKRCGLNDWVQNFLWGDQIYPTAFHYAGFDEGRLRKLLLLAGFYEVSRVEDFPVGHPLDCSRKVSTLDGKPISLNCVAIK